MPWLSQQSCPRWVFFLPLPGCVHSKPSSFIHSCLLSRVLAGLVHVYCHVPHSVQGPGVKLVGTHAGSKEAVPLALLNGAVTWHLPDGSLDTQLLDTHQHQGEPGDSPMGRAASSRGRHAQAPAPPPAGWGTPAAGADPNPSRSKPMTRQKLLVARCQEALALCHFAAALGAARTLGGPQLLCELALTALQFLELRVAVAAYETAGDEEALAQLRPLLEVQDENLVTGRIRGHHGRSPRQRSPTPSSPQKSWSRMRWAAWRCCGRRRWRRMGR